MELSLFLSMLGFLWVAAITPGPNNMLLTTSGANFGFMRSLWLMIGIMLGMQSILVLVAFGVGGLILIYPSLHLILKILGSLYLLWLAWKVATAAYEKLETDAPPPKPVRLYQGWLLQFLNPKAWLMALGAVASFSLAGDRSQPLHSGYRLRYLCRQYRGWDYLVRFWYGDWPPAAQQEGLDYL